MNDDDKKHPQNPTDSFDEHELDLNTSEDLEAIEDVTFADTVEPSEEESMAIFDEFDDTEDFEELAKAPETETEPVIPHFEDEITQEDLGYRPDNTATELLQEEPFSFKAKKDEPLETDEDLFTSDAFEDVDTDFPEGESSKLGDSQLFDYDPASMTTEEELESEEIYAQADSGGPNVPGEPPSGGKGKKGGSGKGLMKNRRVIRLVLLVILAGAIYAVLRIFMGSGATTMELTTTPVGTPPPLATGAAPAAPAETQNAPAPAPAPEQTPETQITSTEIAPPPSAEAPTPSEVNVPVPTPVQSIQSTTINAPAPATNGMNQTPQTTLTVSPPGPGSTVAPGNEQINHKLDNLEASIQAIDNRLDKLGPAVKSQSVSAGMKQPEVIHVDDEALREALVKLNGIDKKISHLSELQTQIQVLNKEVNELKSDVVQQSMIVGQNQAHINENMVIIEQRAPKMYVQAAIPGRAWLRSETGQLITVIPGDEVAGYGRVMSIDATTGTVVMSSRAVFREQ